MGNGSTKWNYLRTTGRITKAKNRVSKNVGKWKEAEKGAPF